MKKNIIIRMNLNMIIKNDKFTQNKEIQNYNLNGSNEINENNDDINEIS